MCVCFHSCTFQALASIDIERLGLQLSTKFHERNHRQKKHNIRGKTFWACFRQELNFQSPSLSAVFPPFSAVFCPLNFPDNIFCRIPFRRLLEKCCKCQNATNNSSEIAFCGAMTVSLTHSATQTPCPQCWMMIDTIAMWNRIYQGFAFAGIETKTSSAIYPS